MILTGFGVVVTTTRGSGPSRSPNISKVADFLFYGICGGTGKPAFKDERARLTPSRFGQLIKIKTPALLKR